MFGSLLRDIGHLLSSFIDPFIVLTMGASVALVFLPYKLHEFLKRKFLLRKESHHIFMLQIGDAHSESEQFFIELTSRVDMLVFVFMKAEKIENSPNHMIWRIAGSQCDGQTSGVIQKKKKKSIIFLICG